MSDKYSGRAEPIPKAMLGAKGWVVIMALAVVIAVVIIYYLKTL